MNVSPSFDDFVKLSQDYNLIPLYLEMPADLETPISLLYKVFDEEPHVFLLESMEGPEKWARYSFIGFAPSLIFRAKGKKVYLEGGAKKEFACEDPFLALKKLWEGFRVPENLPLPRFFSGFVGYVSYEMVSFFEKRVKRGEPVLDFHDLYFILPRKLIVYDRLNHTYKLIVLVPTENSSLPQILQGSEVKGGVYDETLSLARSDKEGGALDHKGREDLEELYHRAKDELLGLKERLRRAEVSPPRLQASLKLNSEMERASFEEMVQRAKKYIERGDIIQVVLSQRFYVEDEILKNPHLGLYLYRALRKINPSPYMFYLRFEDEVLIGSSPEILVRAEGKRVETRPIAGTRRRGKTEEEDLMLEEELKRDEKELAEHIMLVDLGRNDLGRVCEYGSVQVYDLMVVERYSHVMHLVSGVKGRLKDGADMFSLFKACFPAGTVSGAPKVRAMEIITELEEKERGPYAGAVGYFGFNHTMDFCITIRTFFQKGGRLYLQAGAGIVADSNPKKEYEETINKAKALEKALELFSSGYFD